MLKMLRVAVVAACLPVLAWAQSFEAGKDYTELATPIRTANPDKIEVLEFFSYGCPHCNNFDPMVSAWHAQLAEDVSFDNVPVVFNRSWEALARTYYAATELKVEEKVHRPIFDALHVDKKRLFTEDAVAEFMAEQGIDEQAFRKAYTSFATEMRMKKAEALLRGADIQGVPNLVVNGKYKIDPAMAGGLARMLEIADYLIEKERAAKN
ncbi:thiol:disulfide interchange protein DsbA/DsbL [Balneatrix alpica]|uniref:Thiol:disulfide interchange protein n=1 Tax=Balneatrix alpica TaxID=75684 RepID=A0ABV5Z9K6_9GAMM|nr:thiol:disulfide interchange protein DsbA/DsbL [Balneatrix alpica]